MAKKKPAKAKPKRKGGAVPPDLEAVNTIVPILRTFEEEEQRLILEAVARLLGWRVMSEEDY